MSSTAPASEPSAPADETQRSILTRPSASLLAVALVALLASAAVAIEAGWPQPHVADEFNYLLLGDTFARLRLANPPHELWRHFESFFLIHDPSYSTKYPPAQGVALALGSWLGHPILGVWLSLAAMGAAITWLLRAWLPPGWALLGGLLAVLQLGITGPWGQSYWGGAIAATGGALLYGGLRRMIETPRVRDAAWMGAGLVLLANSRPYEGLVFSLPAAIATLVWLLRGEASVGVKVKRALLPLGLALGLLATWTMTYNRAVTGSAWLMPYTKQHSEYPVVSLFIWQKLPPEPKFNHWVWRNFRRRQVHSLMGGHNPPGLRWASVQKRWRFFRATYLPNHLALPLLLVPLALRDRWRVFALLACLTLVAGQLLTVPVMPHYSAPLTGFLFLFVVLGLRTVDRLRLGRMRLSWIFAAVVGLLAVRQSWAERERHGAEAWSYLQRHRPEIEQRLESRPGKDVVVVSYGRHHNSHEEWVFNSADIDSQEVIWAHSMGDLANRALRRYYKGRKLWLLEVDTERPRSGPPKLSRYRSRPPATAKTEP